MPRAEPLQLKAAACQTFAVYQENHGDPLHVQVIIIIIILRMRRSVTDIYIYIYTYRESLGRNHEPCAKALGNYPTHAQRMRRSVTDIYIYTHRESLVRNHEPCAKALGNYIHVLDIRISADASRRLQLKAAACQTFAVYQENRGDPLQVQVIIIIILRMSSACAEA